MAKRAFATLLWFYAFWYLGATIALYMALPSLLGPILGIAAGAIVGLDPRGLIWTATKPRHEAARTPAAALRVPTKA